MFGTNGGALHTGDAVIFVIQPFRLLRLGFWIMAPFAAERAAFEEYSCSDTRSVVNTETLYTKDNSPVHINKGYATEYLFAFRDPAPRNVHRNRRHGRLDFDGFRDVPGRLPDRRAVLR